MPHSSVTPSAKVQEFDQPAIGHGLSHLRFWGIAASMLCVDLWSKSRVFSDLAANEIRPVIDGVLDFRRSLNTGAVFGSFNGQTTIFIIASLFAFGFVVYLFLNSSNRQRGLHIALGLILSGALGNLYDRSFVVADVVDVKTPTGTTVSWVVTILSEPGDAMLRVGDFPDGTNPRSYDPDQVQLRRQGVVRDFIKFVPKFPKGTPKLGGQDMWPWVFNIADAALVIGVMILLVHTWFDRSPIEAQE